MSESQKKWIDDASYEDMLARWRFAELGDQMFQGETGDYYAKVMHQKRDALSQKDQVSASKSAGWRMV